MRYAQPDPYIEFHDVSKAFGDNVVLTTSASTSSAETGASGPPSGRGQVVSLHHIMGFSGRFWQRVGSGRDITNYNEAQKSPSQESHMVFQNARSCDSLTVGENVRFPLRESGDLGEEQIYQIVDGLLKMVGVQEMRDLLPVGLSTGMKRSVCDCARAGGASGVRALVTEPRPWSIR